MLVWGTYLLLTCNPWDPPAARDQVNPNTGVTTEEPGAAGCPAGMARVADFCVDRYEGSLVEQRADGVEKPWSPYHNPGAARVRAVSVASAVPQGYISGVQAKAACERSGKRLCNDAEWKRACMGRHGFTYPYGEVRHDSRCNDARVVHPAIELFGKRPDAFSRINNPCINQLERGLARTGAYVGCRTEDGVFDMMGNLHEWTADSSGTFRGGYYVDTKINGNGCLYRTTAHSIGYWDYSTGFRCCADLR